MSTRQDGMIISPYATRLRSANLLIIEGTANQWYIRDAADTAFRDMYMRGLYLTDGIYGGDALYNIQTRQTAAGDAFALHSYDGAALIECGRATAGRIKFRFPDQAGIPGAAQFQYDPATGAGFEGFIFDTTNNRLYYWAEGGVHYISQTAGFEIPADEKECSICGLWMKKNEFVCGQIDSLKSDGARHGLYVHLACALKEVNKT